MVNHNLLLPIKRKELRSNNQRETSEAAASADEQQTIKEEKSQELIINGIFGLFMGRFTQLETTQLIRTMIFALMVLI